MEDKRIEEIVHLFGNLLYRICVVMLRNTQDAEDVVQEVFCRYLEKRMEFADREHEKAWLITVAHNLCKDMLRFRTRHPQIDIDDLDIGYIPEASGEVLEELMQLPAAIRAVIYLHYIEGYKIREISKILKVSENVVKKRLQRGREQLRIQLETSEVKAVGNTSLS